jgi:periplasmic divalent cation tolerance protein
MSDALLIKSAFADKVEARKVSRILLRKRLVSAAQIKKIDSLYWWQEQQFEEVEWEVTFFSRKDLFYKVAEVIQEHHSYELPEVIALEISKIPADYLSWIEEYTDKA